MVKICFVTSELSPFTQGGIGVLIQNLILEYECENVDFHVLSVDEWQVDEVSFSTIYPEVKYWRVHDLMGELSPVLNPPESSFTTHQWHYKSYQAAKALQQLALRGVEFDIVEFPDWGGLAFCSCQEKLLGNWNKTRISIRLHSTDSILRQGQPVMGSANAAHLADLERKALRDADIIVAHLYTVAEATKAHFGFDESWLTRVRIDAPPINMEAENYSTVFHENTPICFPSKIQDLKRPEVFLKGALAFLKETPEYKGDIIFIAHLMDQRLKKRLISRIPPQYFDRISFHVQSTGKARMALLSKGISVFPSPFESFCLAAYEASALGGWVVLNVENPAFADETNWKAGENCLKFDGTALSLAESLGQAWRQRNSLRLTPVRHEATDSPYFLSVSEPLRKPEISFEKQPLVSVIVPYFNMGRYIERTLRSVLSSTYLNIEVIVIDDCSDDSYSQMVLTRLSAVKSFARVRVISAPTNVGLPAARNIGIRASHGKYIFTIDSDDLIRHDFIEVAVLALERNPDFSLVIPQTAFVSDEASVSNLKVIDHAIFVGEALRSGSFCNRFSTASSLGTRVLYQEFSYDENLTSYEDWDFYSRAAWAGKRFIVTSDVFFYYRRRPGSMIANNSLENHIKNLSVVRAKQRVRLHSAALDMNILTDAERYLERGIIDKNIALSDHKSNVLSKYKARYLEHGRPVNFAIRIFWNFLLRREVDRMNKGDEFDASWYLAQNPDVEAAGMDPARHFVLHGRREGRAPKAGRSMIE